MAQSAAAVGNQDGGGPPSTRDVSITSSENSLSRDDFCSAASAREGSPREDHQSSSENFPPRSQKNSNPSSQGSGSSSRVARSKRIVIVSCGAFDYQLGKMLGRGGMGDVYLAWRAGRGGAPGAPKFALKIVRVQGWDQWERVSEEVRLLKKFRGYEGIIQMVASEIEYPSGRRVGWPVCTGASRSSGAGQSSVSSGASQSSVSSGASRGSMSSSHSSRSSRTDYEDNLSSSSVSSSEEGEVSPVECRMLLELADFDLRSLLKTRRNTSTLDDLLDLWIQCAKGVEAIHKEGVVHFDLKPANFLCIGSERITIKLADFGIAAQQDGTHVSRYGPMGTVVYMAPETIYQHQTVELLKMPARGAQGSRRTNDGGAGTNKLCTWAEEDEEEEVGDGGLSGYGEEKIGVSLTGRGQSLSSSENHSSQADNTDPSLLAHNTSKVATMGSSVESTDESKSTLDASCLSTLVTTTREELSTPNTRAGIGGDGYHARMSGYEDCGGRRTTAGRAAGDGGASLLRLPRRGSSSRPLETEEYGTRTAGPTNYKTAGCSAVSTRFRDMDTSAIKASLRVSFMADTWALGIMLYEMIYQQTPW